MPLNFQQIKMKLVYTNQKLLFLNHIYNTSWQFHFPVLTVVPFLLFGRTWPDYYSFHTANFKASNQCQ